MSSNKSKEPYQQNGVCYHCDGKGCKYCATEVGAKPEGEKWKTVADFTKLKKGGIDVDELLEAMNQDNNFEQLDVILIEVRHGRMSNTKVKKLIQSSLEEAVRLARIEWKQSFTDKLYDITDSFQESVDGGKTVQLCFPEKSILEAVRSATLTQKQGDIDNE